MSATIHPTALVHKNARLGKNVIIGPYSIVGENAILHDSVQLKSHVFIEGVTEVGEGTIIYPFSTLGTPPQDRSYKNTPTRVVVGKNTIIREHVSITAGTEKGGEITSIGDHCFLMASVHIGHDCLIGNNVIICTGVGLAGHIEVDDYAYIGGLAGIHQFVRIGRNAMLGGCAAVLGDVIPFGLVQGNIAHLKGLNLIGLKRLGLEKQEISIMNKAFKNLFYNNGQSFAARIEDAETHFFDHPYLGAILDFLKKPSKTGICMPKG